MNEAKLTDITIAQLGAGIINMVQAKVKLENISKESAEAALAEEEKFYNPTMNAVNSFGEGDGDGDEGGKAKDGNPVKKNEPKPEGTGAKK